MAENDNVIARPEGLKVLKVEGDDESIFVINEALNYYQRKLRIMTHAQVRNLAHHTFGVDRLQEAKSILKYLWSWRELEPSSDNDYIYKNLDNRRNAQCANISKDIIDFLVAEERRLNVTFLTQECELMPSKVTEEQAMSEVYVLLHNTEMQYDNASQSLEEQRTQMDQFVASLRSLEQNCRIFDINMLMKIHF